MLYEIYETNVERLKNIYVSQIPCFGSTATSTFDLQMDELQLFRGDTVLLKGKKRKESVCIVLRLVLKELLAGITCHDICLSDCDHD